MTWVYKLPNPDIASGLANAPTLLDIFFRDPRLQIFMIRRLLLAVVSANNETTVRI